MRKQDPCYPNHPRQAMNTWLRFVVPLLTGIFLFLFIQWSLIQTIDRCTLEVKTSQNETLKLYFQNPEDGSYQENDSGTVMITRGDDRLSLVGAIPPGQLKALRIDPFENDGSLTIFTLSLSNSSFPVITMGADQIASQFDFHQIDNIRLNKDSITIHANLDPKLILKDIPPISFRTSLLVCCLLLPIVLIRGYFFLPPQWRTRVNGNADWLFAAIATTGTVLLYSPGFLSGDSIDQWRQVLHPDQLNNWHPPIMAHVWMLTNCIIPGPQGMLVLHVALYFSSLTIFSRLFFTKVGARIGYLLIIGFFPVTFLMTGAIWKDVSMLVAIAQAIALLLCYLKNGRKVLLIFSLLFMFYGVLVRHNALITVIPYAFLLSGCLKGATRHKLLSRIAATVTVVAIFAVVGKVYDSYAVAEKNRSYQIENSVFIWDLWGMSLALGENLVPLYAFAEDRQHITLEEMAHHYIPYTNSIIFTNLLASSKWTKKFPDAQFKKDFLQAVINHPATYILVRVRLLGHMLHPDNLLGHYMFGSERFEEGHWLRPYSELLQDNSNPVLIYWLRSWTYWLFNNTPIFSVWIYLVLTLIQLLYFYRNWVSISQSSFAIIILSSGLLYWLPYAVVSTSSDYRYSIFMIFCTLVPLPVFFYHGGQQIIEKFWRRSTEKCSILSRAATTV